MKKRFLKGALSSVKKKYPEYGDEKLEEISYGLEAFYLTITKMIIVVALALSLEMLKETFILMICYNILRSTAFGLHASKSIYCLITSILLFVGGAYFCEYVNLALPLKIILSSVMLLCIIKYAPADTEKRPIVNKKKRKIYKIITTISAFIFFLLIIVFNKHVISNYLLLAMIEVSIMIHPLIYKLFKMPYDNYLNYKYVV